MRLADNAQGELRALMQRHGNTTASGEIHYLIANWAGLQARADDLESKLAESVFRYDSLLHDLHESRELLRSLLCRLDKE